MHFQEVSVSAEIDPNGNGSTHTAIGTAYLTTRIGPGTTTANQLASVPFSVTGIDTPVLTTLFSGLTLGAGTYYLVLSSPPNESAGWEFGRCCPAPPPVTAPGVTLVDAERFGVASRIATGIGLQLRNRLPKWKRAGFQCDGGRAYTAESLVAGNHTNGNVHLPGCPQAAHGLTRRSLPASLIR